MTTKKKKFSRFQPKNPNWCPQKKKIDIDIKNLANHDQKIFLVDIGWKKHKLMSGKNLVDIKQKISSVDVSWKIVSTNVSKKN